jgi:hypothetical protein
MWNKQAITSRKSVDCHNEKGKFYQENKAKKKKNDIENFILTK